jgi:hypothetical protein
MILDQFREQLDRIETRISVIESVLASRPLRYVDNLLTVQEASKEFKLSEQTIRKMKDVQVRIGKIIRVSRQDMDRKITRPGNKLQSRP